MPNVAFPERKAFAGEHDIFHLYKTCTYKLSSIISIYAMIILIFSKFFIKKQVWMSTI